ncbi:MAG: phosphotransferase [Rhodocyclaceae bacterium]
MDSAQRIERLAGWLSRELRGRAFTLEPASGDASFRRYFRVCFGEPGESRIAMDAPPEHEDCRPFVHVARLLAAAGLNAPRVLAANLEEGFLLLTDLGRSTYLDVLNPGNADALFEQATDALLRWQCASRPGELPPYDEALLRRELALFPDWYVGRHLGVELAPQQRAALEAVFGRLVAAALAQPATWVHRDFMPRNLMVSEPNPGILDFQDAVMGPVSYDLVSLFRDAFVSWEEERVLDWTVRYWERAKRLGVPVRDDFGEFYREFEWMGVQRHLKVLGIFARIRHRDGKPRYLEDAPRFVRYVREAAGRYAPLAPLVRLFDELEGREARVVYG